MRQLVLVIGAHGQLGEATASTLAARHEVVAWTRAELDITNSRDTIAAVRGLCPDVIVNCAAYNDVERAESEPTRALEANAWAVRSLARAATEIDATLVHYSTDFVFSGETERPYVEDDAPAPKSAYGISKLLGEWLAEETPKHYVLRVESLFGGARRRSSIDSLLNGIREGRPVRAFCDRHVSPSFVADVVSATEFLVDGKKPHGLYHCVNSGFATWTEVADELRRLAGRPDATIEPVRMADVKLIAGRPQFAALSNAKLTAAGFVMPTWQDALARYIST